MSVRRIPSQQEDSVIDRESSRNWSNDKNKKKIISRGESYLWEVFGLHSHVDIVARQILDHDHGIFHYVKFNKRDLVMEEIMKTNGECLNERDIVGATPLHIAFLYQHYDLGKELAEHHVTDPSVTYSLKKDAPSPVVSPSNIAQQGWAVPNSAIRRGPLTGRQAKKAVTRSESRTEYALEENEMGTLLSPYEGETILHIAIMQREPDVAIWLVRKFPQLIETETIGKFFSPQKNCYYGGTPFLFAMSTGQLSIAKEIMKVSRRERIRKSKEERKKKKEEAEKEKKEIEDIAISIPLTVEVIDEEASLSVDPGKHAYQDLDEMAANRAHNLVRKTQAELAETKSPMFSSDRYGNNVLHMAVLHDNPDIYDYAVEHVLATLDEGTSRQTGLDKEVNSQGQHVAAFLHRVSHDTYHHTMEFLKARNNDALTPLSLAAAIGNENMFLHILEQSRLTAWKYGPIIAYNIPLVDLEQPMPKITSPEHADAIGSALTNDVCHLCQADKAMYGEKTALPPALVGSWADENAWMWRIIPRRFIFGRSVDYYPTAIEVLCSYRAVSSFISPDHDELQPVIANRLKILAHHDVQRVLHKKWKFVGQKRFITRYIVYWIYLISLTVIVLTDSPATHTYHPSSGKRDRWWSSLTVWGIMHIAIWWTSLVVALAIAVPKFLDEFSQLVFRFKAYTSESGAGTLDNICSLVATSSLMAYLTFRFFDFKDASDSFAAIGLIFSWFYHCFFLLGFRPTGPFIVMIVNMVVIDMTRFALVYSIFIAGFSQALYILIDGRETGFRGYVHRTRELLVAGLSGEMNYDDNYTESHLNILAQLIMISFIAIMIVLMLNLLIAMMGNTYDNIRDVADKRWLAERANIMAAMDNQASNKDNRKSRLRYALPLITRRGREDLYVQVEKKDIDAWGRTTDEKFNATLDKVLNGYDSETNVSSGSEK